ncbi:MAG: rRNA adenine N-6-methyltransferase family protein [Propionivibrio sp.]
MIRMFMRFLFNPGTIGTISPSSSALAQAMVRQIGKEETVFEIGAGTGAITRHLQRIEQLGPLVVFEQDHQLAEYLRRRVGVAHVVEGYFHDTVAGVGDVVGALVIVSSLPFRSLPAPLRVQTVDAICERLLASPGSRLIQYTYFDRPPFVPSHRSLRWQRVARVWANVPPATVWELCAEPVTRKFEYIDARRRDEQRVGASRLPELTGRLETVSLDEVRKPRYGDKAA